MGHEPVLLKESVEFLHIEKGNKYIDATFGAGGHTKAISELGGSVLALDWDPEAVSNPGSETNLRTGIVGLVNANFSDIEKVARDTGFYPVAGVLFDLGISSIQLDNGERGFSFQEDSPLDMRINKEELGVTAADLVNGLREDQLYELFKETSEERVARTVARAIVRARSLKPIVTTGELVGIVKRVAWDRKKKTHPATTIFLALRMAVNTEIENLEKGLGGAFNILDTGGRLVVISFHSGEDRVVKDFIRVKSAEDLMMNLTEKPITPTEVEILRNPRARSAKLRVGERKQ